MTKVKALRTFIDPPGGWMHGFPRSLPTEQFTDEDFNCRQWLIDNGYPEDQVDFGLKHLRMWVEGH